MKKKNKLLKTEENLVLKSKEDKELFTNTVLNPPLANDKLKRAKESHDKYIKKLNNNNNK